MDPRPRHEPARDTKVVSEVADDGGPRTPCQGFSNLASGSTGPAGAVHTPVNAAGGASDGRVRSGSGQPRSRPPPPEVLNVTPTLTVRFAGRGLEPGRGTARTAGLGAAERVPLRTRTSAD
jgi:hypothetical protein